MINGNLEANPISIIVNGSYKLEYGGLLKIGNMIAGSMNFKLPSIGVGDGVQLGYIENEYYRPKVHLYCSSSNSYGNYAYAGVMSIYKDGRILFLSTISGECRVTGTFAYNYLQPDPYSS